MPGSSARFAPCLAIGAFLCLPGLGAHAQQAAFVPTNEPAIRAYAPPPAGFHAETASAAALKFYGFPQRPSAAHGSTAYEAWERAVSSRNTRLMPEITRMPSQHLPRMPAPGVPRTGVLPRNSTASNSTNWSGVATVNGNTHFTSTSFYTLWGEFVVPIAQQAFGTCSSTMDYSSIWIGLDGFNGGSDVMQAGTEADVSCVGDTVYPNYYAWFEWYPGDTYRINNLPIGPGHAISMQLVADNTTTASLYVTDETANTYIAVQFNAPSGTVLTGSSAEWIVERPQISNSLPPLTNYAADFMSNMVAIQANNAPVFGANTSVGNTVNFITMVDTSGNTLSSVYAAQSANAAFHVAGSAK